MTRLLIPAMLVLLFVAQSVRIVAAEPDPQQSQAEPSEKPAGQGETTKASTNAARRADLKRTGLNPYRVAPPDILVVQALRLTPKSPYHIQSSDFLEIVVSGLPAEKPMARTFQVDSNGMVNPWS